jgi:hypothetical protein
MPPFDRFGLTGGVSVAIHPRRKLARSGQRRDQGRKGWSSASRRMSYSGSLIIWAVLWKFTLTRGPAGVACFATECRQSRWHRPPMTIRTAARELCRDRRRAAGDGIDASRRATALARCTQAACTMAGRRASQCRPDDPCTGSARARRKERHSGSTERFRLLAAPTRTSEVMDRRGESRLVEYLIEELPLPLLPCIEAKQSVEDDLGTCEPTRDEVDP